MNKNNNPLNIKAAGDAWKGMLGTDARGHAIFQYPAFGIRAAARTLQAKQDNGKRTLRQICRDWAPATDTIGSLAGRPSNTPDACADYLARRLLFAPDEPLPQFEEDVELLVRLTRHMARWELGEDCPMSAIMQGIGMWLADFVEHKPS